MRITRKLTKFTTAVSLASLFGSLVWAAGVPGAVSHPVLFPPKPADKTKTTKPGKTALLSPKFMQTVSPTPELELKWSPVENASHYFLQISKDPVFKWVVYENLRLTDTSMNVGAIISGVSQAQQENSEVANHYYWRVAAVKADNDPGYTTGFFETSRFEIK